MSVLGHGHDADADGERNELTGGKSEKVVVIRLPPQIVANLECGSVRCRFQGRAAAPIETGADPAEHMKSSLLRRTNAGINSDHGDYRFRLMASWYSSSVVVITREFA